MNDGPDPVTIAQVTVDDAYWAFTAERGTHARDISGGRSVHVPYPWVAGEAHLVKILTSTGTTFEHEIAGGGRDAASRPRRISRAFALIGLYVGVIPVALGLLLVPACSRGWAARGLDALLALTIGLLAFLFVDAVQEGLRGGRRSCRARIQGTALFVGARRRRLSRPRSRSARGSRRGARAPQGRRRPPGRCSRC